MEFAGPGTCPKAGLSTNVMLHGTLDERYLGYRDCRHRATTGVLEVHGKTQGEGELALAWPAPMPSLQL